MLRLPLRRYLFLLAIAGILPLALLSGAGLVGLFGQQRRAALDRAQDITRALATAVDAQLQRSTSALQVLATSPALAAGDLGAFHGRARAALASQPDWLYVDLANAAGERLVDTHIPYGAPIPLLGEKASVDAVFRTEAPAVGSLAKGHAQLAFALRAPVVKDGRVRYVLGAVVDPAAILRIVRRQQVPEDWVISVFDERGMRVARSRAHEQFVGTPAAASLRDLMASDAPEGTGLTTALEGDVVLTAYTRLPNGWSVAIGLPEAQATAAAARSTAMYALAVALSIAVGLLAALWLARRANRSMARLREAAVALGRGEQPDVPSTEIVEVHDVGAEIVASARQRMAIEGEREELLHREQAARAEAENANRAKDLFLAMLAHELRNPLAAISNASALLDDGRGTPDIQARARDVIRRQTRHLARLTDDLLDAARALLGKIELQRRPIDLAAVAAQSLRTFATTGRGAGHRLAEDLGETWVVGDPVRLDQVVCNLLENAVKYTPPGGVITLRTGREGDAAVLRVTDTGVGLSPELAPRVFELFWQGARGIDRTQGGLGIGLTLVKRLVELHGGGVEVRSDGEGRGSEFTVRLLATENPGARDAPPLRRATTQRNILVVEDNDDARETLQALLETIGHSVEVARDGVTGLEMALALAPDVGILDIGLPGIDGYELARRLRAAGRRTFLIALTGYGSSDDRARVIEAGFDAHLTKPADLSALEALIARSPAPVAATS